MARVLLFCRTKGDIALCRTQLQQLFIDDDFDGWLESRKRAVGVWGTLNPEAYFHPRLGKQVRPTPPENPSLPPDGPARDSIDCLRLVHRYGEAQWEEVKQLHQQAWDRFLVEDRRRRAAEPPPPPPPEGRYSWGRRYKAALDAKRETENPEGAQHGV